MQLRICQSCLSFKKSTLHFIDFFNIVFYLFVSILLISALVLIISPHVLFLSFDVYCFTKLLMYSFKLFICDFIVFIICLYALKAIHFLDKPGFL